MQKKGGQSMKETESRYDEHTEREDKVVRRERGVYTKKWGWSYIVLSNCKNEVGCRDDTGLKTVDTRKHCKVGLRACNLTVTTKKRDVGREL